MGPTTDRYQLAVPSHTLDYDDSSELAKIFIWSYNAITVHGISSNVWIKVIVALLERDE